MRSSFTDTGIVIRCQDYKEADKIVTILTKQHGLISTFSQGSRRSTSKKSPHLDLFNLINFSVDEKDGHHFLRQVDSLELFLNLKSDLNKISLSLSMLEVINSIVPQSVDDPELFTSTVNFLKSVDSSSSVKEDKKNASRFARYLLRHLGYPETPPQKMDTLSTYLESIMNKKIISKEIV